VTVGALMGTRRAGREAQSGDAETDERWLENWTGGARDRTEGWKNRGAPAKLVLVETVG
jgi:hypothetical protein